MLRLALALLIALFVALAPLAIAGRGGPALAASIGLFAIVALVRQIVAWRSWETAEQDHPAEPVRRG